MRILTPEQVITHYQYRIWRKTASTRIKQILTEVDVQAELEPFFFDLEGRRHEIKIGRCICRGVEGERWTTSVESLLRDRYPVGEKDADGYQEYKMKNPRAVFCFDIPFPFILRIAGKADWQCSDTVGAIITWNGETENKLLDMRVVKKSVFEKTYEQD